jgi:hypothetical protein
MQQLDVSLRDEIDALLKQAKQQISNGDKVHGIKTAESAWEKLPDPKFEWDVSKSFAHSLAKFYRNVGDFASATKLMTQLFNSGTVKDHQDGPRFVFATIFFEKGDVESAMKWFAEANKISKGRCFQGEDPKYLEFFKRHAPGKK